MTADNSKGNKGAGKVSSAGAVEIKDEKLDQAAGGAMATLGTSPGGTSGDDLIATYDLKMAKK